MKDRRREGAEDRDMVIKRSTGLRCLFWPKHYIWYFVRPKFLTL